MPTRSYRHTASFVQDWRPHSRPLDRNERAKILFLAEALERRSKSLAGATASSVTLASRSFDACCSAS
jgi:hypothetical protein